VCLSFLLYHLHFWLVSVLSHSGLFPLPLYSSPTLTPPPLSPQRRERGLTHTHLHHCPGNPYTTEIPWPRNPDTTEIPWPGNPDTTEIPWPRNPDTTESPWPRNPDTTESPWPRNPDTTESPWPNHFPRHTSRNFASEISATFVFRLPHQMNTKVQIK